MTALAWVISLIVAFVLGYHYNALGERLADLSVKLVVGKQQPAKPEVTSIMVDADDPQTIVRMEYEERMNQLNPELHGGKDGQPRR